MVALEATDTMPSQNAADAIEAYKRNAILDLQRAYIQVFDKLRAKSHVSKAKHNDRVEVELWQPGDLVFLHSPKRAARWACASCSTRGLDLTK